MKIYPCEEEAGLSHLLLCNRIQANSPIISHNVAKSQLGNDNYQVNGESVDLYYLRSILVTTGWNLNDHVFTPEQTWAARYTPLNKPFNYQHIETDIIGHTIDCNVLAEDMVTVIPEDTPVENLPPVFHLSNADVIYVWKQDEVLRNRMTQIVEEIHRGEWFVSMECLFNDFDYAMRGVDAANYKVVARNDTTAYLTKHLKQYGGDGLYNGQQVGMILKNFVFSGKGLVRNPANPSSYILSESKTRIAASVAKEMEMETKIDEVISLLQSLKAAEDFTATLSKELATAKEQVAKAEQAVAEAKTGAESYVAEKIAWYENRQTTAQAEATQLRDELAAVKQKQREQERVASVVANVKFDLEKARQFVASADPVSDEEFEKLVKAVAEVAVANAVANAVVTIDPPAPKQTASDILDTAVPVQNAAAAVVTPAPASGVQKLSEDILNFFKPKTK